MATRSGVRAPYKSGPVRSPYTGGNKMLTAAASSYMMPMVVQRSSSATRTQSAPRTTWRRKVFPPDPPVTFDEIEINKRYRQQVAARIGGKTEVRPPAPVTTRGIAAAYEAAERRRNERHVEGVAYRLGLR